MERYAVYSYECMYGGLHSMYNTCVVEGTKKEAEQYGEEMSLGVMDDYQFFQNEFEASAKAGGYEEGSDEFDEYVTECYDENIAYEVGKIREDVTLSTKECEKLLNKNPRGFLKEYCE